MEDLFFGYVGLVVAFLSIGCAAVSLIAVWPIWKERDQQASDKQDKLE